MSEIIDSAALLQALEQPASKNGTDQAGQKIHGDITATFKNALQSGRKACEQMLLEDGEGVLCARRLCHLTDTIIETLYDFTTRQIYPLHKPPGRRMHRTCRGRRLWTRHTGPGLGS